MNIQLHGIFLNLFARETLLMRIIEYCYFRVQAQAYVNAIQREQTKAAVRMLAKNHFITN